jgi:hypothetical protein
VLAADGEPAVRVACGRLAHFFTFTRGGGVLTGVSTRGQYVPMMTNTYRVEFSIFGADATPAWKRAIVSAVTVEATSPEEARELAGYGDATWSVTVA